MNYLLDESKVDVEYLRLDPATFPITVAPADVDAYLAGEGAKAVKDYYDSNKSEFNKEARVKARHILISYKGARNATGAAANRSEDEAKALAATVLADTKKPGTDFAALASLLCKLVTSIAHCSACLAGSEYDSWPCTSKPCSAS
ncbi:MAG: hypothetical protein EOO77_08750 [Oxalobacteraceae bacterium]|nr:MAG: hypothetical protein EOO77_08750 [Oxalobacteraceae bacterium]